MFTTDIVYDKNGQEARVEAVENPRLLISSDDFPEGIHIEVKTSDDGGLIVEAWDESTGEFMSTAQTITFDELFEDLPAGEHA